MHQDSHEAPDNLLEVQGNVLEEQFKGEEIQMLDIAENGPFFRYFAEHLSPELYTLWQQAAKQEGEKDIVAIKNIGEDYGNLRNELNEFLDNTDPETRTALTIAMEKEDYEKALHIFETYVRLLNHADEEKRTIQ